MAFVNSEGTVVELVSDKGIADAGVEQDHFTLRLVAGNYKAYAFANITPEEVSEHSGVTFTPGSKMTGNPMSATFDGFDTRSIGNMPMSGCQDIKVLGSSETESFEIEVVRMFAKIELDLRNASSKDIVVENVSFGPLNAADASISLMPLYSALEDGVFIPGSTPGEWFEKKVDLTLTADGTAKSTHFYTSEVISNHTTGHFLLNLDTRTGNDEAKRRSLLYGFHSIYRNDWMHVPVKLADWYVDLEIQFYPPIGGYPAFMKESRGDEFYAKFGSSGTFIINVKVTEADGNEPLPLEDFDVAVTGVVNPGLFKTIPERDDVTYEIIGEIATGVVNQQSELTLEITVPAGENVIEKFIRKIYIIRESK
ncbi:MAG: hypothetical protein NC336_07460 [Clostridium sp.]|nr:hypothetical protein [Clostridium sp.]